MTLDHREAGDGVPNSRTVVLTVRHGHVLVLSKPEPDGQVKPLPMKGELSTETLAEALGIFDPLTRVVLVGTRADGSAGWDGVGTDEVAALLTNVQVVAVTDVEAFHLYRTHPRSGPQENEPTGYLILFDHEDGGTAYWYYAADGILTALPVACLGNTQLAYHLAGGPMSTSVDMVISLLRELVEAAPTIERLVIWSPSGMDAELYGPKGEFQRWLAVTVSDVSIIHVATNADDSLRGGHIYQPPQE